MSQVDKLIKKVKNAKDGTDEFWINCYEEMQEILTNNLPQTEKDKLLNLGFGEVISMMYEGIISTQE